MAEPVPAGSSARTWALRIGVAVGLGVAVLVGVLFGPILSYVADDQKLDGIVLGVALDWRDFGIDKARENLQYELDHQRVGPQIGDDSCALTEADGTKEIRCAWKVDYIVPLVGAVLPLGFESVARISPDGDLR